MTEPAGTSAVAHSSFGVLGLSVLLPGMDGNALIGAFAGATLFVLSSTQLPMLRRLVYMQISFWIGYLGAPEVLRHTTLTESGVAAFFGSAAIVTLTLHGIRLIQTIALPNWLGSNEKKGGRHDE